MNAYEAETATGSIYEMELAAIRKTLGATEDETTQAALKRMLDGLHERIHDSNTGRRSLMCSALGMREGETPIQAAERVVKERDTARRERDEALAKVEDLKIEAVDLIGRQVGWIKDALAWDPSTGHLWEHAQRIRDTLQPLANQSLLVRAQDLVAELALLREAVEQQPTAIPVKHLAECDGDRVVITIHSRDPAVRAMPMGSKLGLVVLPP